MNKYNFVDLLSGCGGTALGMEKAGLESILLNDINNFACKTLRRNRPYWNIVEGDISEVDFSKIPQDIDVLTASFPVQAFSIAKKTPSIEKTRETIFFQVARAIKELHPKVFILENIKGLLRHDRGYTLETIKNVIGELGYYLVEPQVLNAKYYNVPHQCERLILVGIKNNLAPHVEFKWPDSLNRTMTLKDAFYKGVLFNSNVPTSTGLLYPKFLQELCKKALQGSSHNDLTYIYDAHKQPILKRLSLNTPCLPLSPLIRFRPCHPLEARPLQTREFARIQTFPDSWEFSGEISTVYQQISNAFPVNMAMALGRSIIKLLDDIAKIDNGIQVTNNLTILDKHIFDCLRTLAGKKDDFVKGKNNIHNENKINKNLAHYLNRYDAQCSTEQEGNGRCDLLLSGQLEGIPLLAIIECKKILSNDTKIEIGKKLSSASEQVDAYGDIRPYAKKYIIFYIFDKKMKDIHKIFYELGKDNEGLNVNEIDTTNQFCDMYSFNGKKVILCGLRTIPPTESFKNANITKLINIALSESYYQPSTLNNDPN